MSNVSTPAKTKPRQWATHVFYTHLADGFSNEQTHELRLPLDISKAEVEEVVEAIRSQFEVVD